MKKVITYGTYDVLHYGHIRLLERAKALGDYLIVGVTSDDFDKTRGKINNQQSFMDRVAAVKALGIADEVIAEEYEGQKIDDIRKHNIDIFTVGSDWEGYFDYLKDYCEVVYLPRTQGVSSTDIRSEKSKLKIGIVGESTVLQKFANECRYVNGTEIVGMYSENKAFAQNTFDFEQLSFDELIRNVDAVYIASHPSKHYDQIKYALENKKHVLCESPVALDSTQYSYLCDLANKNKCVLMDAIKTAYSTAYSRLLLMVKSGKIGKVVSVDATCTSLKDIKINDEKFLGETWNSICAWGPTAMLPILQILGTNYNSKQIASAFADKEKRFDIFTKIDFYYPNATASIKVGKGVKSEGELIITGTKGYVYVPAPWWKTDYFELRYENPSDNRRCFYQLNGEGIRYEIVAFLRSIENGFITNEVSKEISQEICSIVSDFENNNITELVL